MLRAKQLGTLSQSARTFFLSGPRCSAADGSSCTCSEDETCISRRPLRTNVQHLQGSSALVTKTSLEVDSRISTDAGKVANSMVGSSPPQVVRVSHSLDRGNCFNYAHGVDAKEMMHLSPPITDQIVKAGFVAVGVLSDLVNNKIPVLDGMLNTPPNSLVERSKPISNIRSVNVKTSRKDKIHGKSSAESSHLLSHLSRNLTMSLMKFRWSLATKEALGNLNYSVDAFQANQILKQLLDYNVALGFFYWLKQQPGFKHDGHTYTTMVGILGRARQFGSINKLLDQMVSDGCLPNVVTYNRLIYSYGRANYLNEALGVFIPMQKSGCEPDRVTYCTLIDIHAKAGYLDVSMDMYQRMQEAGLSPDTFTYSVIINCLGKAGHLAAADKLFCEMVNHGAYLTW
ncbi:Hypothetical predicted protein [Olea europaea subsp. europaea]|uniref:Pentatricopeptide repeat-containing protein n=1 Tax=Olea europaea subsp. europaea TaxID=158383 RepID=A0A8S0V8Q1_OLEEU|nr:Hypothetical predicted protein [Olea europaea subsp. europaea]